MKKFSPVQNLVRLTAKNVDRRSLVDEYAELAFVVHDEPLMRAVSRDSDDDHVLACAIAGECEIIVTGDADLLDLRVHRGIRILTATVFLAELNL